MNIDEIHKNTFDKLDYFIENDKIPHIIFHGEYGSGKRTILNKFINKIYHNNNSYIQQYVMYVNCSHSNGKGIRFFRDNLKFFAKTNILNKNYNLFKSIILFNADKLTIDSQSALRRCIETYSHTTRFFIIAENKNNLLKPILSRFCCIFIPTPNIDNKYISFHDYNNDNLNNKKKLSWLKKNIKKRVNYENIVNCKSFSNLLYERGYSGIELIDYIDNNINFKKNIKDKYLLLTYFDKIRKEFRNEKIIMFIILYFTFMRKNINLENILNM